MSKTSLSSRMFCALDFPLKTIPVSKSKTIKNDFIDISFVTIHAHAFSSNFYRFFSICQSPDLPL